MSYILKDLPYSFSALEPYIDAETMELHHDKHHAAYIAKLNAALEKFPDLQQTPLEKLLSNPQSIPEEIRSTVRNNGGGHYNHSLFWNILGPDKTSVPQVLKARIDERFDSFENFRQLFETTATNQFGSGWAWLGVDENQKLTVIPTANQDTPLLQGVRPVLGIDVWEHAYYLNYRNRRPEYIKAFWSVINWDRVASYLEKGFSL